MDIFISWSGDRARGLAKALRDWLKCVIQTASPWMSDEDIGPGTRWGIELAKQLENTNFGILCLTKESLSSPWLLFEAGALAKALTGSRVCPVPLDADLGDLPPPLAQFNGVQATEEGLFLLVRSINRTALPSACMAVAQLDDDLLRRTFKKWWPDMQAQLDDLPPPQLMPLVLASNDMGVEFVFEKRGPALEKFAEYLDEELAKNEHGEEWGITIVGTSLRAFLVPSAGKFDGKEIIRRALKKKCPLRILLTDPEVSEQRARQEGADAGAIARQIRESIRELCHAGAPKQTVRYYCGGPTVFGIATSSNMLLNPSTCGGVPSLLHPDSAAYSV